MMAKSTAGAASVCMLCIAILGSAAAEPIAAGAVSQPSASATPDDDVSRRRSGAVDGTSQAVTPNGLEGSTAIVDVPNTSKTVELLLEMQGKNPGLEGGERPKAELPKARSVTDATPTKPAFGADPGLPFGGADTLRSKPVAGDPQGVDWSAAPASQFGGGGLSAAGGGAGPREPYRPGASADRAPSEDDVRWLIPRSVVRFVRENRDMVILGSVLLLVLLWAWTAIASNRRK